MKFDFTVQPSCVQQPAPNAPFHTWALPDDQLWLEFHRNAEGYLLRFPNLADFSVSRDGLSVSGAPVPEVSEPTLQHLYINQVLPLAFSLQGKLVFHASTIALNGYAVAFFGESGRGKSTLAASFARGGYPFLTEDVMVLELRGDQQWAMPSHPSVRLWSDSRAELIGPDARAVLAVDYNSKVRFLAGGGLSHCDQPLLLRAAYQLGEGVSASVCVEPMSQTEALIEAVKQSFQMDIEDAAGMTRHFEQVTAFCRAVPCFKLDYPRKYSELESVKAAIIAHAQTLVSP